MAIAGVVFFLLLTSSCLGLNINLGVNNVLEVFGFNSNDLHQRTEDLYVEDEEDPPPHDETARMARYISHNSDWAAMATVSAREPTVGYPFANIFSVSDGPVDNSTGVPYMYISPWEISARDLSHDNKASLTMSLAQSGYCRKMNYDPEDPRCAHVILTGHFVKLDSASSEGQFAKEALFSRHPIMPDWPEGHHWFFAKLDIQNILILDYFGGAVTVPVQEYFQAKI